MFEFVWIRRHATFRRTLMPALLALVGVFTACAPVGPNFETPRAPVNPLWSEMGGDEFVDEPQPTVKWWQVFNDPVLNQLIEKAHQNNNNLRIAGLRVLEARAALGIATGSQYPQTQFAFGDVTAFRADDVNSVQYNIGLTSSWEIDFWGKFRRGVESADAAMLASIASFDDVLILLTAQVADTYTTIRTTEEQLEIANENIEIQRRSYNIVDVLFRNGESAELDALQARTLLLSTEAAIPQLEALLRQAENALSTLLGEPPGRIGALLGDQGELPAVPVRVAVGIPADTLRQRPDVRQAEMQSMAQNAQVGVARAGLYPSFSITGSLGLSTAGAPGESDLGQLFNSESFTYGIGPSFTWPFFNYGRLENNVRVQDARLQQSLFQYREIVIQAAREVEDAMAGFHGTQAQAEVLLEAVQSARRSAKLAILRYTEGFSDYQRVLDAQQALFTQQERYVINKGNEVRSLVSLYKALGGGWQTLDVEFVDEETRATMEERTNWGDMIEPSRSATMNQAAPDEI
ncbi:MAG: transporter [Verrucomicrobia bacterium]|nr:MAG: transporter [Verrucomicrobiota bacterium]